MQRIGDPPAGPVISDDLAPASAGQSRRVRQGIDVLACPRCGGRLRLIATVEDPAVVGKIQAHPGLLPPRGAR